MYMYMFIAGVSPRSRMSGKQRSVMNVFSRRNITETHIHKHGRKPSRVKLRQASIHFRSGG